MASYLFGYSKERNIISYYRKSKNIADIVAARVQHMQKNRRIGFQQAIELVCHQMCQQLADYESDWSEYDHSDII